MVFSNILPPIDSTCSLNGRWQVLIYVNKVARGLWDGEPQSDGKEGWDTPHSNDTAPYGINNRSSFLVIFPIIRSKWWILAFADSP